MNQTPVVKRTYIHTLQIVPRSRRKCTTDHYLVFAQRSRFTSKAEKKTQGETGWRDKSSTLAVEQAQTQGFLNKRAAPKPKFGHGKLCVPYRCNVAHSPKVCRYETASQSGRMTVLAWLASKHLDGCERTCEIDRALIMNHCAMCRQAAKTNSAKVRRTLAWSMTACDVFTGLGNNRI